MLLLCYENKEIIEYPCDQATTTYRYFNKAMEFIGKNKKQPFFVYLTPSMPHVPLFVSPQFKGKSKRGLYGEDVKRVRAVLQRIINADSRILDTPAPIIVLGSLSASSVDITVRVWVKSADYWSVLYDINEIVYTTFNEEGIGFPFPQLTVHRASE